MSNLIGQSLGRYQITKEVGVGGMATVYKAVDTHLDRDVAVKFIKGEKLEGKNAETVIKRFQREAKALARLSHPNILTVLDYGEYKGHLYLVTEFVTGGTLKEKLGQSMPWAKAAKILAPIARAVEYTHSVSIIHRDIKPTNILLSSSGIPKLADFGIAKLLESDETTDLTRPDSGPGTPDYMAPEQAKGNPDARSDVYSLGVVFYELITGHKPYVANTPFSVMLMHATDPLPPPKQYVKDLPDAVEKVINKALEKRAESRYQSMEEFARALEGLVLEEKIPPLLAPEPTKPPPIPQPILPTSSCPNCGQPIQPDWKRCPSCESFINRNADGSFSATKPLEGKQYGTRVGAYAIDFVIRGVLNIAIGFVTGLLLGVFLNIIGVPFLIEQNLAVSCLTISNLFFHEWLYFALFEWLCGSTFGKSALKIRVVNLSGEPCNLWQAVVRAVFRLIDGLFLGVLAYYFMKPPLYQRLGDRVARTIVIESSGQNLSNSIIKYIIATSLYISLNAITAFIAIVPGLRFV